MFLFSKAAIETEIRQHVAAEERAYRWVEKLSICDQISRDEMVQMVRNLNFVHVVNHTKFLSNSKNMLMHVILQFRLV